MKYIQLFTDSLEILDDLTHEQIADLLLAIRDYSKGKEVKLTWVMKALFVQFKQWIDRSKENYNTLVENGKKYGRNRTKKEENPATENKAKQNKNSSANKKIAQRTKWKLLKEDEDEEKEDNKNILLSSDSNIQKADAFYEFDFSQEFWDLFALFEKHRKEKRQKLTQIARERMLKNCQKYGEKIAMQALEESLRNGRTGVFFEKCKDKKLTPEVRKMDWIDFNFLE